MSRSMFVAVLHKPTPVDKFRLISWKDLNLKDHHLLPYIGNCSDFAVLVQDLEPMICKAEWVDGAELIEEEHLTWRTGSVFNIKDLLAQVKQRLDDAEDFKGHECYAQLKQDLTNSYNLANQIFYYACCLVAQDNYTNTDYFVEERDIYVWLNWS